MMEMDHLECETNLFFFENGNKTNANEMSKIKRVVFFYLIKNDENRSKLNTFDLFFNQDNREKNNTIVCE